MLTTPQAFIFIGRSGCGKGTQANLLMKVLKEADATHDVIYIQSGAEVREFTKGDSLTQKLAKSINDVGGFQPEFLMIYLWSRLIVEKYNGSSHLVFDGTPRKLHEAAALDSVFDFYKIQRPWIIEITISTEEAFRRLKLRKRADDTDADIKERLSWYEKEVVPTINYFRKNTQYKFAEIDGERTIEEIHADIVKKVGLV